MEHECIFCGVDCDCNGDHEDCEGCDYCNAPADDELDDVWGDDYSTPGITFDDDGSDEGTDG